MAFKTNDVEWDFVYVPEGTPVEEISEALESVSLLLGIGADRFSLDISSKKPVTRADLQSIVDSVSNSILKKMRINVREDCDVFYIECGKRHTISFLDSSNKITVDALT